MTLQLTLMILTAILTDSDTKSAVILHLHRKIQEKKILLMIFLCYSLTVNSVTEKIEFYGGTPESVTSLLTAKNLKILISVM